MYAINENPYAGSNQHDLLFNGKIIGVLMVSKKEAEHIIKMLNTHPLADED